MRLHKHKRHRTNPLCHRMHLSDTARRRTRTDQRKARRRGAADLWRKRRRAGHGGHYWTTCWLRLASPCTQPLHIASVTAAPKQSYRDADQPDQPRSGGPWRVLAVSRAGRERRLRAVRTEMARPIPPAWRDDGELARRRACHGRACHACRGADDGRPVGGGIKLFSTAATSAAPPLGSTDRSGLRSMRREMKGARWGPWVGR